MKLKLLSAAAAAAMMITTPTFAQAGEDSGWYLRGLAGYGTHTDIELSGDVVGDTQSEGNATGSAAVGYDFGNNWRLEADYADLATDLGKPDNVPGGYSKLDTQTMMLNLLYDFSDFGNWEPYVGAGLGLVRGQTRTSVHNFINQGGTYAQNPTCPNGDACSFADSDSGLGWELLAGLGYNITDNLSWDTQYRYMSATDMDFDGTVATGVTPFTANRSAGKMSMEDIAAHSLLTGLRYRFGAAKPMMSCWDGSQVKSLGECPAQPPAMVTCWDGSSIEATNVCPPRPMQVCWDGSEISADSICPSQPAPQVTCWDGTLVSDAAFCPAETRSGETVASLCGSQYRTETIHYDLNKGHSPETKLAIDRILDVGQFCQVDNIRVVGHTDRSGSAAYNMKLSQQRAKDARDELVGRGINSNVITSEGKGETEPFIPTADGVKEPLNRRTEVLIHLIETGSITTY